MLSKIVCGLSLLTSLTGGIHVPEVELADTNGTLSLPRDVFGRAAPNYYGDPIQGDPVTGSFCDIGRSVTRRRDLRIAEDVPILAPRAPVAKQPLENPASNSEADFATFFEGIAEDTGSNQLFIEPPESQTDSWKVTYKDVNIPIGATAVWFPFGNTAQNYVLSGLTGCTAIIAVSSHGIWAGHLWEGSKKVNGGSAFMKKFEAANGKILNGERSKPEFQKVAVDIFGVPTPVRAQPKRVWKSIEDLKQGAGNPFQNGNDVEVFILTKAKSPNDRAQQYPEKITQLRTKFAGLIPYSSYQDRTYAHEDPNVAENMRGTIAVQYTPYDHDNGCTPQARVRIFYENNQQAVIDKSWDSTAAQVNSKRRRNACPAWNTTIAATAQITASAVSVHKTATGASFQNTASAAPYRNTTTAASGIKCVYQDATPDNPVACTCVSGSSTTVVQPMTISSVSVITQSCAYSTWPSTQPTVTAPPLTISTNIAGCQVCTVVGPNEDDCSPLPSSLGCTTAKTSTILSGDTKGVTVGTLTGSALYSAITSGIDKVCQVPPDVGGGTGTFTCTETATATLATDIKYTEPASGGPEWNNEGQLTLTIQEGNYDSLEWYSTAKAIIAAYAQNSTQNNCKPLEAQAEIGVNRRDNIGPGPFNKEERYTICKVGSSFQLIEVDPYSNTPARELSFDLQFQADTNGDIFCEFLEGVVEFIETVVNVETDTEVAAPAELEVDEKLLAACEGKST